MRANQGSDHANAPESQGQQRYCKEILAATAASKNSSACCDQERPGVGPGHWFGSQCGKMKEELLHRVVARQVV